MNHNGSYLTKDHLFALVQAYLPYYQKHGIACQLSARVYDQQLLYPTEYEAEKSVERFLYNIKAAFLKKYDEAYEDAIEWSEYIHIPCLILRFFPMDGALDEKHCKEYSFPLRKQTGLGLQRVSGEKTLRAMEKILQKKQTLVFRKDADKLCKNTFWDYLRYIFGPYGYKKTIWGIRRESILAMIIFLPAAMIVFLLVFLFS